MPRKKKIFDFSAAMQRLRESGLNMEPPLEPQDQSELPTLTERIRQINQLINKPTRKGSDMIFFVMYDIEDNRVRRLIVKYLEQKGCHRVQRSIFLADQPISVYNQMRQDLAAVQATYENNDSILIVPISTDYLNSMKIIGKNIDIDLILKTRNTLFF